MRAPNIKGLLIVVLSWLILPVSVWAQTQGSGGIAGPVKDATGAVLPGVTVEAASPALIEKVRSVTTDGSGQYKIIELPPGVYAVSFTLSGFNALKREGIELNTGFMATVNAELPVGSIAETILVSGASPVVDVQNVVSQRVMTRDVIDSVPSGKMFVNLAVLIPGMSVSGAGRAQDVGGSGGAQNQSLAINGGRSFEQVIQVDAMNIASLTSGGGTTWTIFPDGSVEEINLASGAHSAEMETGGVRVNIIPKSGGNVFKGSAFGSFTGQALQANNLSAALKARGLASADHVDYISDFNPTLGGPIIKDRLWFYGGYRSLRTFVYSAFYNDANPTDWVYTPDASRPPAEYGQPTWSVTGRLTWQASTKNKFNVNLHYNHRVDDHFVMSGTVMPEAALNAYFPARLVQATWQAPVTNRLLLEAGVSSMSSIRHGRPEPGVVGPAALELSNGFQFRARSAGPGGSTEAYPDNNTPAYTARASASYVTGAHAFKVGFAANPGTSTRSIHALGDYLVVLLNGMPNEVRYFPYPYSNTTTLRKWALFGQDQWTVKRLTLNAGLRFDWLKTSYPAQHEPANALLPARDFSGADVLNWKDLSPRLGAAYDLFGHGRTALKVSVNRYVNIEATDLTDEISPAVASGSRLSRAWVDSNGDFIPQGDPLDPLSNGELVAPSTNRNFGNPVFALRHDASFDKGWGVRGYNWETSAGIQHELLPSVSVTADYVRRWYGNFSVIDNVLVTPADYDPFCITAPRDARLPGGGGQQICGRYDLKPTKVGLVSNVRTLASSFGTQYEHWQGGTLAVLARLKGVLLQGGVNTGKTITDNCDVVAKVDNPSLLYCHQEQPLLTQAKLLASYTFPARIEISGTLQSIPGITTSSSAPTFGVAANYVATNGQIAPSLGRNLSTGSNGTVTVNLITPGTLLSDRMNQLDLRVARTFTVGRTKFKGMIDIYNALNGDAVLGWNDTYGTTGASWFVPNQIVQGRLVKFGGQLDF